MLLRKVVAPFVKPPSPRPHPQLARLHHLPSRTIARALRPGETPQQALERRLRESERVEERVVYVTDTDELDVQFSAAGERLVVIEIRSEEVCETGFDEEPELQWKDDKRAALEPCRQLKHSFQRIARDCPDVVFLCVEVDELDECTGLCERLGVEVLPSVQFWRGGKQLWEHRGVDQIDKDLGEGVLFFGDTGANNEKASAYIRDLYSAEDLADFVSGQDPKVLSVVDVSLSDAAPCIHIFPAVWALARSFAGYAAFSRLLGDANEETRKLMGELGVMQVPTFLFYRGGELVGRHTGSSRGDLIGQILQQQAAAGIAPPTPAGGVRRRVSSRRRKL
jgi:hypothetical protein